MPKIAKNIKKPLKKNVIKEETKVTREETKPKKGSVTREEAFDFLSEKSDSSESSESEQCESNKFIDKYCDSGEKSGNFPDNSKKSIKFTDIYDTLPKKSVNFPDIYGDLDEIIPSEDNFINNIIKPPCLIVVAGKSKRGKSYLIKYMITMLCLNKKFKFGLVFCKTKFNCGYDFIEDNKVIEGYKEDILKNYLQALQKYGEEHPLTAKQKAYNIKTNIPPSFIIFDDIIGQMDLNAGFMSEFITTYRHYNITLIIATQYLHKVPVLFREQADICVMFYQNTKKSIDACYENYGQEFDNAKKFKNFLIEKTSKPYHCLIYIEDGDDINTKYMEYKAPSDYPDIIFKF